MLLIAAQTAAVGSGDSAVCLPTCDAGDARFLALAGTGLNTLHGRHIVLGLASPGSAPELRLGIFDGDTGGRWDAGATPLEFELLADPLADGAGGEVVRRWSGAELTDDAWSDFRIPNAPQARSPGGSYFYRLEIRPAAPADVFRSNFKVRASSLFLLPHDFSFEAVLLGPGDFETVYPEGFPGPSTYSGEWSFFLEVPATHALASFDGDLDHGSADCAVLDDDDPDTPNDRPPPFAGPGAVAEGVALGDPAPAGACTSGRTTGSPPDDFGHAVFARPPSVVYELIDPLGRRYPNSNPSGNREWERFLIDGRPGCDADPADGAANADHCVEGPLPPGIWQVRLLGVDLSNLNAWRFDWPVLGLAPDGRPVPRLRPLAAVRSPGFWKTHPAAWPAVVLELGGRRVEQAEILRLLAARGRDKSRTLGRAAAAAWLNLLAGNDASCVAADLERADEWLARHPPGSSVGGGDEAWREIEPVANRLDAYNNGRLCASG